jgi:phosphoenolpyruvate carboxykinase (ATP)
MNSFDLRQHELSVKEIHRNLPPSVLYVHAIRYDREATIATLPLEER